MAVRLQNAIYKDDKVIVQPPLLPLSSAHIDRHGAYLMDTGSHMYLWLGAAISDQFCHDVLGVPSFQAVTDGKVGQHLNLLAHFEHESRTVCVLTTF